MELDATLAAQRFASSVCARSRNYACLRKNYSEKDGDLG